MLKGEFQCIIWKYSNAIWMIVLAGWQERVTVS